jgi:rod shape determining protein RodA
VLALARYYHQLDPRKTGTVLWIIPPFLMIVAPVALVMHQPDLGTSLMILFAGVCIMFLGGLLWRIIAAGAIVAIGGAIFAYFGFLHEYQRQRVDVFLGITQDPLGAGYHVLQSKIAIGSAGLFGRGWMQGTQSQLDFLPEKHTDFIFTMIVEEFGLLGGALVLGLFGALLALTMQVAYKRSLVVRQTRRRRRRRDARVLCVHQYGDGDWSCAGRRHSAADDQLWRHGDGDADGRLRDRALRRPPP